MTKVIFRRVKESGRIVAFFVNFKENGNRIISYQHVGKYNTSSEDFYINNTEPTDDFFDLLNELLIIGCNKIKIEDSL